MVSGGTLTAPAYAAATETSRPRSWPWAAAGAILGAAVWLLMGSAMSDDAHMTASYARTLADTGQWGMVAGLPSNTATSPLSVLLLAPLTLIVRDVMVANGVLLAGCLAGCGALLHRIGGRPLAAVGLGFLASSPLLVSTVGLESYLAVTLMVAAVWAARGRRWWLLGVVAGLLVLCRADLGVVAVVAVVFARRGWWQVTVAACAVTVPWLLWSWFQLGSFVPDTLLMKAGGGGWGGVPFPLWFLYYTSSSWGAVVLALVPAVAGVAVWPWWLRTAEGWLWGVGGAVHYVTMTELAAGLHFWYAAPAFAAFGLLACRAMATRAVTALAAGGFVAVCTASLLNNGIPPAYTPLHANWGATAQYRAYAATLPPGTWLAPGEVGVLAFYAPTERGARVLDGFADQGYITDLIDRTETQAPPWKRALLQWNYLHRPRAAPQPLTGRIVAVDSSDAGLPPTIVDKYGGGRTLYLAPGPVTR